MEATQSSERSDGRRKSAIEGIGIESEVTQWSERSDGRGKRAY
jgi:hypothetical protein